MYDPVFPFLIILGACVGIGAIFSRSSKKPTHYYLGNRSLGWFPLAMSFVATQVGGGFLLGTAEAAFRYGVFGVCYAASQSLGFLALALGLGAKWRALELNTGPELFEKYYGSRNLKRWASLLSILSLTGILIAQAVGLRKFFYSMGWSGEAIFLISWMAIVIYTMQGGFLAVVWTDCVQAILMIGALLLIFGDVALFSPAVDEVSWLAADPGEQMIAELACLLMIPFLSMCIEQDMVQRCFAGRNGRQVTLAAAYSSAILLALALIPVYFGSLARALGVIDVSSSKFMDAVLLSTNAFLATLAASAVLLAIASTASSLLCAASSNLAQDFFLSSYSATRARVLTALLGVASYGASFLSATIFDWMIGGCELGVDCLFVPALACVFAKEDCLARKPAAIASVILGAFGFALRLCYPLGIFRIVLPLALSGLGYLVGMAWAREKEISV